MDKIKKLTYFFVILIVGCTNAQKFDSAGYNLKIEPGGYTEIDLNTGVLRVDLNTFKYIDTIEFSDQVRKKIIDAFYKSPIKNLKGERSYTGPDSTIVTGHPTFFKITLLVKNKVQTKVFIQSDYHNEPKAAKNDLYKMVGLRDTIIGILRKDSEYNKSQAALREYIHKNPGLLMYD